MFNKRPKWIRSPRRLFGGLAAAGAALGIAAMVAGAALFGGEPPTAQAASGDYKEVLTDLMSLTITEGQAHGVKVWLSSQPSKDTTVVLDVSWQLEDVVTFSKTELSFTTTNWSEKQAVRMYVADDSIDQSGNIGGELVIYEWSQLYATSLIPVVVQDNDDAGDDSPVSLMAAVYDYRSVNLHLDDGPDDWWFRINSGGCTAASGTGVNGIGGYGAGTHNVVAYSDRKCSADDAEIASSHFTIPKTYITVKGSDPGDIDVTLAGGPTNWWYKFNPDSKHGKFSKCRAASGNHEYNVQGYSAGDNTVAIYSDNRCGVLIGSQDFTVSSATLSAEVAKDNSSFKLTITDGPSDWWWRIENSAQGCVAVSGTSVTRIAGYYTGTYKVKAYSDDECYGPIAALTVTIEPVDILVVEQTKLVIDEGQSQQLSVSLSEQPSAHAFVSIGLSDSLSGAATITPNPHLIFTPKNWSKKQTVTINAVDDSIDRKFNFSGNVTVYQYYGLYVPKTIPTVILDDENAEVVISGPTSVTVGEGTSQTVSVSLDRRPPWENNLITVRASDSLTYNGTKMVTVSPTYLIFTQDDWSQTQTVTLTAANDSVDQAADLTGSVTFRDYSGWIDGATLSVTVDDDDDPLILLSDSSVSIQEGYGRDVLVSLNQQPSADVTLSITAADSIKNAVTLSKSSLTFTAGNSITAADSIKNVEKPSKSNLTFTAGNWSTPQTVRITAVDDTVDQPGNLTGSVTFSDTTLNHYVDAAVQVTVEDDDQPSVEVSAPWWGVTIDEGDSYDVDFWLSRQPLTDVTVTIAAHESLKSALSLSASSLTFTTSNWSEKQTVTINTVDDSVDQASDLANYIAFTHTYQGQTFASSIWVTIEDDDNPRIEIAASTPLIIDEGSSGNVTVLLDRKPASNVTVSIAVGDSLFYNSNAMVTTSPSSLTFTPDNYSARQSVTINAVNDSVDQIPDLAGNVTFSDGSGRYDSKAVHLTVDDDDDPAILVSGQSSLTINEGANQTVSVSLNAQPPSNVTVAVAAADAIKDAVTLSPGSLTFTPKNWATQQTVTITAVDDSVDQPANLAGDVTFSDSTLQYFPDEVVQVTVHDDDAPYLQIPVSWLGIDEGDSEDVSISLSQQPLTDVTVAITVGNDLKDAVTLSASSLTFTTSNWATQQTLTITAVDDSVDQPSDHSEYVTFSYTYQGENNRQFVWVEVDDDDDDPTLDLRATVDSNVWINLELKNGPSNWWFKINQGSCTAASGSYVGGIYGYQAGTYQVKAFSDSTCATELDTASFTIQEIILTATVNDSNAIDLALANGPHHWWFKINNDSCTPVQGTRVNGISGYGTGAYNVIASSNPWCNGQIDTAQFTID